MTGGWDEQLVVKLKIDVPVASKRIQELSFFKIFIL
jgi:hypothetical protein